MPEYSGRTVKEAIEIGLQDLKLSENEATITIVEEGHTGVFGLGSKQASVRVEPVVSTENADLAASAVSTDATMSPVPSSSEPIAKSIPPVSERVESQAADPADQDSSGDDAYDESDTPDLMDDNEQPDVLRITANFLQNMLGLMGLNAKVEASVLPPDEEDDRDNYYLNIAGDDLGILIGRRAETLDAIQYLVRMVAHRHSRRWPIIEVDVEHYKQRRELTLQRLAETMADKAVREQRTIVLEAMPARERRLVHIALRDRDDVFTQSIGEDDNRKVSIVPS